MEDDPSTLRVYDALGNFLSAVTLTGCPGPNDQCDLQDLSVAAVPEPTSLGLLGAAILALRLRVVRCRAAGRVPQNRTS